MCVPKWWCLMHVCSFLGAFGSSQPWNKYADFVRFEIFFTCTDFEISRHRRCLSLTFHDFICILSVLTKFSCNSITVAFFGVCVCIYFKFTDSFIFHVKFSSIDFNRIFFLPQLSNCLAIRRLLSNHLIVILRSTLLFRNHNRIRLCMCK